MPTFPPALLVDGRRLPGNADTFRRLVKALDVQPGERVALLGAADGASLKILGREFGAQVTAVEWEPALLSAAEARVREENLSGRVTLRSGGPAELPRAGFDVVIVESMPPPGPLTPFAAELRELLALNGRLGLTLPAAVGLSTAAPVADHWARQQGAPLVRPQAMLGQLEQAGFEPQWAEALSDEVLAEHYRLAAGVVATADAARAAPLKDAIALFTEGPGRTGSAFVMIVGRRREPGEKPPAARTSG